jgi:glyoxylase-like metal-dependent hydrolase (beta-lactamase superfamily II)
MNRLLIALALIVVVVTGTFLLLGGENGLRKTIFAQAMPVTYFEPYTAQGTALENVSGPVYAFTSGFTRSMVVDTPEGLAVFDTFDADFVAKLKAALDETFPGKPVKWVIYSHNHLDHVRGSAGLGAQEVIGHESVNRFIADWPEAITDYAPVTRPIKGDTTLNLGGVNVDFLYMPHSHSQTLYGFHVRDADVVFAPDMMFVRAFPPFDFPDFYYPGYIRALDRLIALQAAHYIPSHLDRGTRQDLVDFRNMTAEFHETVRSELARNGYHAADGAAMRRGLKAAYDRLEPEYGDWHGFDEMFVPKFGRHWGGVYLGY